MCYKLKDPFRATRASRNSIVSVRTRFKRIRTGNKKARLTAAERREAEAAETRCYTTPTTIQQMVVQGNIDLFVANLPSTYDKEVANYNAEMAAHENQVANWVGRAAAAEMVPLPFKNIEAFRDHIEAQ